MNSFKEPWNCECQPVTGSKQTAFCNARAFFSRVYQTNLRSERSSETSEAPLAFLPPKYANVYVRAHVDET